MPRRRGLLTIVAVAMALVAATAVPASADEHDDLVATAIDALGGEDALAGLENFVIDGSGFNWSIDEGFAPGEDTLLAGPYSTTNTVDVANLRIRNDNAISSFGVDREVSEIIDGFLGAIVGQDGNFGAPGEFAMLSDRLGSIVAHTVYTNPQLLLLDVLEGGATATVTGPLTIVIDTDELPAVSLRLDPQTSLPRKLTVVESNPLRRDVSVEYIFSTWHEADNGLLFPMRVSTKYAGFFVQREIRSEVAVNEELDDAAFEFPGIIEPCFEPELFTYGVLNQQHLQSFANLGFPLDGFQTDVVSTELADGVFWLTGGSHHSLAVVQDGGVVVVEAPLDEFRAAALLDWIDANIGLPVTHVVQSHHHADHSAGIRTFGAAGATVVVHEAAETLFADVLSAPSAVVPDALSASPIDVPITTSPDGGSLTLDDATNPVGVHSLAVGHAADYVLVEAGGVLWVVDIYTPFPGVPVGPIGLAILDRVEELGLEIDIVAGGHGLFVTWEEFLSLLPG